MRTNKYVELVADFANVPYDVAKARMDYVKAKFGISYAAFYRRRLYFKNEIRLAKETTKKADMAKLRKENFKLVSELSSYTEKDIIERINLIWRETAYTVTSTQFLVYKFYELNEEESFALARAFRENDILLSQIKPAVKQIFLEGGDLNTLNNKFDKIKANIAVTMSQRTREAILERLNDVEYDVENANSEELEALIIDMEFMKQVFNYTYIEYFMFGFPERDLNQRAEYLTIFEKRFYAEKVCDPFDSDLLDSKWLTFNKLRDYYNRDAMLVDENTTFNEFKQFCDSKKKFIAKPLTELKGNGIELYDFTKDDAPSYKKAFKELKAKDDNYILEELIKQDAGFGAFNPDSVNTVRIISILHDDNVDCKWTFIRVGRKGSFVDNAGSGGVFAAIDTKTGVVFTDASDENGKMYEAHPDTNVTFKGFQIPEWDKLIEKCKSIAKQLPKVAYIGWDFTYTEDKEWVLVEANIQPGCRAIQAVTKQGIRKEFLDMFSNMLGERENKNRFVLSVARKMDVSYEEALALMDEAKEAHGVSYQYFDSRDLHLANAIRLEKYGKSFREAQAESDEHYNEIFELTGMDREAVDDLIDRIRIVCNYKATIDIVYSYKLFNMSEDEVYKLIVALKRRNKLATTIRRKIKRIDNGLLKYKDIEQNVEELREILYNTLPEHLIEKCRGPILEAMPEREFTEEELYNLIVDVRLTFTILKFNVAEYLTYHFENKSFEERHKFIANPERLHWTKIVNDKETSETLDDKYLSYVRYKEHYDRKVILIDNDDNYDDFVAFCKEVPNFVKKPLTDSQGKGVELIKTNDETDFKSLFTALREEDDKMVLEELIYQSDITSVFNKDSVNTVRIITFNNGKEVKLMFGFFRTGRSGSFVDNAGSGGVFADVDMKTGKLSSDGGDELGRKFLAHPESGVKYMGFQLPEWDKAVALAKKLAMTIPEMRYVGWDFAYNTNGNWVVVEYNSHPEFVQQGPADHGCRKEFLDTIEEIRFGKVKRAALHFARKAPKPKFVVKNAKKYYRKYFR